MAEDENKSRIRLIGGLVLFFYSIYCLFTGGFYLPGRRVAGLTISGLEGQLLSTSVLMFSIMICSSRPGA